MSKLEPVSQAIDEFLALCISNSIHSVVVALSGGVDSLSLLHSLHQRIKKSSHTMSLSAVYIDHQLQAGSDLWAEKNRQFCESLEVAFETVKVEVDKSTASLEKAARTARYQALSQFIADEHTCLVTGQHLNDQAETFLLQLLRGAGSKGLSAMPDWTDFAKGFIARPLLNIPRAILDSYCASHGLEPIEDPTNSDTDIRRNFVRHKVMPLIEVKWPQAVKTIAAASDIQAENQKLLNELAAIDFENCFDARRNALLLIPVKQLSPGRVRNLLRYWLDACGADMPSQAVLQQIQLQMLDAKEDASPVIELAKGSIRRYRNALYWVTDSAPNYSELKLNWSAHSDLLFNNQLLIPLQWLEQSYPHLLGKDLIVKGRQGGDRIRFKKSQQSISLKNYLQQQGIPPWLRDQVLLLDDGNEICAVYLPE
ncbi:tRNA lysidine(34) synthetase TilS [Kangiella aquimarina]|uniref:tRNA(Ile)-lysidine synthase n=1 Tax=Kangiella aquimarina TaxID=261965 RepID=A0ABZ0X7G4_9GAMM|nr:tRNA lysidine(34) synthetase TilS [Kangiella aquimarina]WQG86336.1 tRNA lysidine(34) synthetase TilS [Kangiella aquimarina]